MKLTTLGGSAAGVGPGQGCSAYLVASDGAQVVLDLGPGTLLELRKHADFRSLAAVVLSHLHLDHMLDVLALRYALAYNPIPPESALPLWVPPGGLDFLRRLAHVLAEPGLEQSYFDVFSVRQYDPNMVLSIGPFSLQFHPTVHYIPCWAIRVSNGRDGDLFYSADTGPTANLLPFAAGAKIVVCEGTALQGTEEPFATRGHLAPSEAAALAREAGANIFVLTHLWQELDPQRALVEAEVAFGGPVLLATPGMQVTWGVSD